jgi:hypothetical protein
MYIYVYLYQKLDPWRPSLRESTPLDPPNYNDYDDDEDDDYEDLYIHIYVYLFVHIYTHIFT